MASSVTAPAATPTPRLTPAEPRYSVNKKVRALYVSIISRFPRTIRHAEFHERMIRAPDSCRASDQAPVTNLGNPLLHNLPRPHKNDGVDLTNHLDQHSRAFFLTRDRTCNICLKPTTSFWSDFRAFYGYYQARPAGKKTIFMPMCHVIPVCSQGDCLTKLKHISRDRFNEAFENLFCQYHRIDGTHNISKAAIFEAVGIFKKALTYCGVCRTKWHSSQFLQAVTFRAHLSGRCMASLLGPMSNNEGELKSEGNEQADNEGSTPSHAEHIEGRTHSEEVFHRRRVSAWQKLRRGLDAGEDRSPSHSPAAPAASPGTNVPVRDENMDQDISGPSGSGITAVSNASNSNGQADYFTPPTTLAQIPRTPKPVAPSSLDVLESAHITFLDGIAPDEAYGSNLQQAAIGVAYSGDSGTLTDLDAANSSTPASVPLEKVTSVSPFPDPNLPDLPRRAPANALGHNRSPWGSKRSHRKSLKETPSFSYPVYDFPTVKWHYPCAEPDCGTCVPCYGTIRSRGGWAPEAPAEASIDEGNPGAIEYPRSKPLKHFRKLFALSRT